MFVLAVTTQGIWSEVSIVRVETKVSGKIEVHSTEVKNQSNLSRRVGVLLI